MITTVSEKIRWTEKVLRIRLKGSIVGLGLGLGFFLQLRREDLKTYFLKNVAIFSIKIVHSTLTDNSDVTSLTSSTFLYNKNPTVKCQTPES